MLSVKNININESGGGGGSGDVVVAYMDKVYQDTEPCVFGQDSIALLEPFYKVVTGATAVTVETTFN
jgi:hypothetical protein